MRPISPVIPKTVKPEVVFARNQPQYNPLPAYKTDDGMVISRWKLTLLERIRILFKGSVWVSMLTFGKPLQPIRLDVEPPVIE